MFKKTVNFLKKVYKENYEVIIEDHVITTQVRIPKNIYKKIEDSVEKGNEFGVKSKQKFVKKVIEKVIDSMDDYQTIFNDMEEQYSNKEKVRISIEIKMKNIEKANEFLVNETRKDNKFLVACLYKYFYGGKNLYE